MMTSLSIFIRRYGIGFFFVTILIVSFIWQFNFRTSHFQECDSSGVYDALYNFPESALRYTALTYPTGHLMSTQTAARILEIPIVKKAATSYLDKYGEITITQTLSHANLFSLLRYTYINLIDHAVLPFQIQGFFSLPLSSTYSAGPGLLYSLLVSRQTSYALFMARALALNLIIFYGAIFFLYLLLRKMRMRQLSAMGASLLMLFSISMYSYAFHLGSTLWNISSELLWLYIIAYNQGKPHGDRNISIATAILIFFNYLLILFWLAFFLWWMQKHLPREQKTWVSVWQSFWQFLQTYWVAIASIFLCILLFFQPGQGNRGNISIHSFFPDIYYITLNFFAFMNVSRIVVLSEWIVGCLFLIYTFYWLFIKREQRLAVQGILTWFIIVFLLFVLGNLLGFAPDRQTLFLAPVVFIGAGACLDAFLPDKLWIGITFISILATLGFYSIALRHYEVYNQTTSFSAAPGIAEIGIYDCSYNLLYQNWHVSTPVVFINPDQFIAGKTYEYVSQTTPFPEALIEWQKNYILTIDIIRSSSVITNIYFTAFNPNPVQFGFTRPNNAYETIFKVVSIHPL